MGVRLGDGVRVDKRVRFLGDCFVGEYSVILGEVEVGDGVWIGRNVTVLGPVRISSRCFVGDGVVIGFPCKRNLLGVLRDLKCEVEVGKGLVEIGDNVVLRSGCVIYEDVKIGSNVEFGHHVLVREKTEIGDGCKVGTNTVIDGFSRIGKRVSIQSNVYVPLNTVIEDHVFLGPNVVLTNDKYLMRTDYELRGPIIRRGASVGANATVLPGVEVGVEAVVGAGAVVTKDVPPKAVVVGVPARKIGEVPRDWRIPMI